VQEPQEGRWSPRRSPHPSAIETLRGGGGSHRAAAKPARGGAGKPAAVAVGDDPWRGEAQGSIEPVVGTTLRSRDGLPEGARPRSQAREGAEALDRSSRWQVGKVPPRGGAPLREGKSFEGREPHERARHEIRPWSSRRKQGVKRAREPWRRNVPGEANPGEWAAAIASAAGARTPGERPHPRGLRRPVPVTL